MWPFTNSPIRVLNPGAQIPIRLLTLRQFRKEFPELPNSNAACRWDKGSLVAITIVDTGSVSETVRQVAHELLKHAAPAHDLLRQMDAPKFGVFACGPRTP